MLTRAIVRPPAATFAQGLTAAALGAPDLALALVQHERYCAALERCGLTLACLPPDPGFPDSTFVEDAAILTGRGAILTRPGAPSRQGEVASIAASLVAFFADVEAIEAPGTVDGGDICQAGEHFLIGLSPRTNEPGASQLAALLATQGFTSAYIDIRGMRGLLHLKTGLSWLGDGRVAAIDALAAHPALAGYEIVRVDAAESYAANCLRINEHVVLAAGHPRFEAAVRALGLPTIALDLSEFRKMDGSLTCLSLRF
ncbi:MAG TPA: arginine deiminase family protein [Rudaea sp.]|nr:arginine deiminase family protein [Rudaea sp.]